MSHVHFLPGCGKVRRVKIEVVFTSLGWEAISSRVRSRGCIRRQRPLVGDATTTEVAAQAWEQRPTWSWPCGPSPPGLGPTGQAGGAPGFRKSSFVSLDRATREEAMSRL